MDKEDAMLTKQALVYFQATRKEQQFKKLTHYSVKYVPPLNYTLVRQWQAHTRQLMKHSSILLSIKIPQCWFDNFTFHWAYVVASICAYSKDLSLTGLNISEIGGR